jgi:hypothetical protein
MADRQVPLGWKQMRSWGQLERQAARAGGVIVIFDDPTDNQRGGPRFHDPACEDVAEVHFETKRANGWTNGAYYWAPDARQAGLMSVPCGNCGGELPEDAA